MRTIETPIPKRLLLVLLAFCFVCAWAPQAHGQISITTASPLPDGVVGVPYLQTGLQLQATGGTTGVRNWTLVSGSLPAGLSLSPGGLISGTPSAAGNSSFRVRVTSILVSNERNFALAISTPVTISTASPLPPGTQGDQYPQLSFAATGGMTPYSWSIASGTLPSGMSLSGGGNLSGTPTASGTFNFTVGVADDSNPPQVVSKAMTLLINPPLTITNSSPLPPASVGVLYSQTLNATGGVAPYTWALASGSLPAGLSLSSAGVISGTPTATGSSNFNIRVTDSSNKNVQKSFTLVVGTAVTITTSSPLTSALLGVAYTQTLSATGGTTPYTWSLVSGALPAGLAMTGSNITGTPTTVGTSNFTIRVTDSSARTSDKAFTLDVVLPLMISTAATLPSGTPGVGYSQNLSAAGGLSPYSWSVISGSLPAGLSLSPAGFISGTPTTVGTASFTIRVLDSSTPPQNFQRNFSISIAGALSIVTASTLPAGAVGVPYSHSLAAAGGTSPFSWSITAGALPGGLSLTGATIAGTPTTTGNSSFTVRIVDSGTPPQSATKVFSLPVGSELTITTTALPPAATGSPYSAQLEASLGPPLTWSRASGSLPPGINLSSTGLLSGSPTMSGTFDFAVRVASDSPPQEATRNLQIVVSSTVAVATTTIPTATRFVPYSTTLSASGGVAPYTWSVASGSLPAGLTLSAAGAVSGTPVALGTSNFTVRVADSGGGTASRAFALAVVAGALSITTPSLPGGVQGFAFSFQFEASGGPPPYAWALVSGSLPAGFTFTPGGVLQGNATAVFNSTIRVRVSDSGGGTDQRDFTLAIGPPLGTVSLTGLAARTAPVQQLPLTLSLPGPYPAELQGTLTLAFTSTAVVPIDDPVVQFSTGGRSVKFTIPANTTTAVFPSPLLLVTGTVAGTVAITGSMQNGPSGLALTSTTVDATPPQMTTVVANRITGGLRVRVIGFSPERRVTDADFSFEVRVNSAIQRVNLSRAVSADFSAWYQSPASTPFGGAFLFEQLFGVAGDTSAIEAVTITLKNAQGNTTSARVVFTAN